MRTNAHVQDLEKNEIMLQRNLGGIFLKKSMPPFYRVSLKKKKTKKQKNSGIDFLKISPKFRQSFLICCLGLS